MSNLNREQWDAALKMLNASSALEVAAAAASEILWEDSEDLKAVKAIVRDSLEEALNGVRKARAALNDLCTVAVQSGSVKNES